MILAQFLDFIVKILIKRLQKRETLSMEQILQYNEKHQQHVASVFNSMGKQNRIQATKVFNFMQNSFDQQQFQFLINDKNFFADDENSTSMEKLLQSYYRITQGDESKKFYLYRIEFTFEQIINILQFWLSREPNLKINYPAFSSNSESKNQLNLNQEMTKMGESQRNQNQLQENNQFDADDQNLANVIQECQSKIKEYNQQLLSETGQTERQIIEKKIEELKMKIKLIEQRIKTNEVNQKQKKTRKVKSISKEDEQVKTNSPSKKNVTINYRAIFDFYAKQTHLTGVKATFERIQHESQSVNYQKLVHFLRQYNLLPSDSTNRKKVHGLYIKNCEPTRDLSFDGFMNVLDGVASLLFENKSKQERSQILKQKIYEKNIKNGKILNHPFHSLEKQDFRIDVNDLKYNFKLKPQDGKFIHQVNNSIQKRRKDKEEAKQQRSKQKQMKQIRYLKKLQSIDPFSPVVLKNSKLLEPKPKQYEPIASLENIEQYRDHSFNFESHFGIAMQNETLSNNQKTPRRNNSDIKRQFSDRYRKGQDTQKKVEKLERDQVFKMENIMSGIIQRTNAKMQKLGISQSKLQKSIKFI